jgi:hypothetical protein
VIKKKKTKKLEFSRAIEENIVRMYHTKYNKNGSQIGLEFIHLPLLSLSSNQNKFQTRTMW